MFLAETYKLHCDAIFVLLTTAFSLLETII